MERGGGRMGGGFEGKCLLSNGITRSMTLHGRLHWKLLERGGGGLLERDGRRMRSRASGLLGPRQTLELTDVG